MYVKIHKRSQRAISNLIEIGTDKTRLLFDAKVNLSSLDDPEMDDPFELEGLTCGEPSFDWVFLSHHYNGYCGLLGKLLPGIPVFAGEETKRTLDVIADSTNRPRPEINFGFRSYRPIQLDDMRVTPIGAEHSARDACVFLIQAEGKHVLYADDHWTAGNILPEVRRMLGDSETLDLLISGESSIQAKKPERHIAPEDFHCGEHVRQDTIKKKIAFLQPKALLPIFCEAEDREKFLTLHDNCLMLDDGECWEVGS